ncbi:molybdenum cofactor biosynthesis protein MoaE [Paracoccus sp. 1_MG-2023]|uniref:molybdenum cofactor biosynthesis protein MoaE n=1 Tax=unclassified Paracoccus (in: a-proteobacteria) TaxID=2688777 RepID=UPI001C087E9F|nr:MULTISPECIES: molybdenum cofactor biosynthesis protein MoaE [unclassified Paracoccus (in: a-proteobacteria)]MBU2956353.1 molybdenum cofactor biosynthesis protein MoaE [Paracoccus sp. C2R09]MDO6668029.1 molybdenum cofactor biosynthesis protein MoaE [Paracoccus sp. 1_MG-2023]
MSARVQQAAFDLAQELQGFGQGAGGIVTFTGIVRDEGGSLTALRIEHYPGMTERLLGEYGARAAERFGLSDWRILHRHGDIQVGDQIMMVATAARHRRAAFEAADYLMDWLKSRAPFWKQEIRRDGSTAWVAAKDSDEDDLARWQGA